MTGMAAGSATMADAACPECPAQTGSEGVACIGGCPVPCAYSIVAAVIPLGTAEIWSLHSSLASWFTEASFRAGSGPPPDLSPPRLTV